MQPVGQRRAQRGQALVLALVLLFAGLLGLFFMFGAGQVSATKQRLNNAADAAAYSAALWRARRLKTWRTSRAGAQSAGAGRGA